MAFFLKRWMCGFLNLNDNIFTDLGYLVSAKLLFLLTEAGTDLKICPLIAQMGNLFKTHSLILLC